MKNKQANRREIVEALAKLSREDMVRDFKLNDHEKYQLEMAKFIWEMSKKTSFVIR